MFLNVLLKAHLFIEVLLRCNQSFLGKDYLKRQTYRCLRRKCSLSLPNDQLYNSIEKKLTEREHKKYVCFNNVSKSNSRFLRLSALASSC